MFVQLIVFCANFVLMSGKSCYWNSRCGNVNFGSKTVYDDVRGDIRDVKGLPGCSPVGVWAIIRHGTRLPRPETIANMKTAAKYKDHIVLRNLERKGKLCFQDVVNLRNWSWHTITEHAPTHQTREGYKELYYLGSRMHQKYHLLLQNLSRYHFEPTNEQRTIQSAVAFALGLSQRYWEYKISNPSDEEFVLNPHISCKKYHQILDGDYEMKSYLLKKHKKMLSAVQKRAGLEHRLTAANISGFYDLFRFYRAYSPIRRSPWCALFTNEELLILEYLKDLRDYYKSGHGSPVNTKLMGTTFRDLFQNFQRIISESTTSFTAYFAHDSLLQTLYTVLGLYRDDDPLTGLKRNSSRKWRTGIMTPFAANFVIVLHKCSNQSNIHQMQFFINEAEHQLCDSKTCSWKEFNTKLKALSKSNQHVCYAKSRAFKHRNKNQRY